MRAFFAIFALAAATAEPQVYLGGSPLVRPVAYHQSPIAYNVKPFEYELKKEGDKEPVLVKKFETFEDKKAADLLIKPTTMLYSNNYFPYNTYSNLMTGYPSMYRIAKREAEADPMMVYSHGAISPYSAAWPMTYNNWAINNWSAYKTPMVYSHMPIAMPAKVKSFSDDRSKMENYAAKGQYVAETEGSVHIAKRDADAQMFYSNVLPYASSWPMTYKTVMPYTASPMVYSTPMVRPTEYLKIEEPTMSYKMAVEQKKVLDNAREKINTPEYAMKGMYVAENAGAKHIAKRDAQMFYSGINSAVLPTMYNRAALPLTTYSAGINSAWNYQTPIYNNLYNSALYY